MKKINKIIILNKHIYQSMLIFVLVFSFVFFQSGSVVAKTNSPKLANYYLRWDLNDQQVNELAKWDLVVLDMEVQVNHADMVRKLKSLNPDIILLVYITPQEIAQNAKNSPSVMRKKLANGIYEDWYLKDTRGNKLFWWPGTYLLNVTNEAPVHEGERLNDYVARFVVDNLLSTGLWDGVFYDNSWNNVTWIPGKENVDINNDGTVSKDSNQKWVEGMSSLYTKTRNLYGKSLILLGNGHNSSYLQNLNGKLLENFSLSDWTYLMNTLKDLSRNNVYKTINFINSNTNNTNIQDYKDMRFGLTSSLLEDAYFSYDYGDQEHSQTWWYDEYDVNLGKPLGNSSSKNNLDSYAPDVWQRSFENGISVVNSTESAQKVSLGGEYEKIHGTQDKSVNDGSIVSQVDVPSQDGLVLLKTFETLQNVLFTNGAFLRFFRPDSMRIRNGFFTFDEKYRGGDQVAYVDLNGNGEKELFVASINKIEAWREDGQKYFKEYPFTAAYTGKMNIVLGDLKGYGIPEIFVAPSKGSSQPIKVYSIYGEKKGQDFYPFGTDYTGGYTLAVGDVNGDGFNELVVGRGVDRTKVYVYDKDFNLKSEFAPFESNFKYGVNVATGDLDGDRKDEIIVGRGEGGTPEVRVFDNNGKLLYKAFTAYSSFGNPGIDVRSLDVDFDGKDDIVTMSEGAF
ncbi:MAG: hypothetical protein COX80_02620 [Candidatus Magasanikbacteria bacterium CG_4_10_14_0_2_um_filter_33_14]|uniref:Uncharacterized protein n=1 Tax=Candidatus Magasanikbacteria bacterium CG_4_10_14_0_2_um_filter_33_14 TaxID=1974636 RepID=A0A2M7VAS8_9BACT|nr:MAG: hypothetical protein COX80_02620 [Candidatus Magasanikbacteria bacterium CG_4_10_14_0_2_um_filter_33_14]